MFELVLTVPGHIHGEAGERTQTFHGLINLPLVCQIILVKKHMIQSVTFIIIRARALHPVVYPPSLLCSFFFSFSENEHVWRKSIRKIFLTFIHSCSVRNVMRSDNEPLCCVIILYIQIQGEKKPTYNGTNI